MSNIQTFDIALIGNPELTGNPDLTGLVPFDDYIAALVEATQFVDKDTFTETQRRAFDTFVEVVTQNAKATMGMVSVWTQPRTGDWSRDKFKWMNSFVVTTPYIFQPPVKGVSSSLAIVGEDESELELRLVAKDVGNFLSKETVITLLETARRQTNHILVEVSSTGELSVTKPVPKDFEFIYRDEAVAQEGDEAVAQEGEERYGFPHDFIGNGNLSNKFDLVFDQFAYSDVWEELIATRDDGGFEEFQSLSPQDLAIVRTFFKKLRKALNNPSKPKSESSEGEVISINGNVVEIAEDAGNLTELVAKGIDRYLEMNWFQLLNPLTISLGGDDADVNVEVDTAADLRTQVRSALRQISAPLARELEYSVYGFDSDAFEVAGELAYFAGFN
tara:strand:+ start:13031 stop:14197 length:1167 start_codon:yes stop_codon:yes gene_type:complete